MTNQLTKVTISYRCHLRRVVAHKKNFRYIKYLRSKYMLLAYLNPIYHIQLNSCNSSPPGDWEFARIRSIFEL